METPNSILDQALKDRLCVLAHDLNNALSVISGNCELLSQHAEPGSECEKRLETILTVVRQMAQKINAHDCRMVSSTVQTTIDLANLRTPADNFDRPLSIRTLHANNSSKAR